MVHQDRKLLFLILPKLRILHSKLLQYHYNNKNLNLASVLEMKICNEFMFAVD